MSTTSPAEESRGTGINDHWPWEDPTSYQWTLWVPKPDTAEMVGGMLGMGILFPLMVYGLFWLISFASLAWAYWLCIACSALMALTVLYGITQLWSKKARHRNEARSYLYSCNIVLLGCILYELHSPLSHLAWTFQNGTGADFVQWLLFFADNTLSVILLDIPEVFDLRLSRIQYEGWPARLLTVIIRLLITAGLVEVAWMMIRSHFSREQIHGSVQDCYWHISSLPDHSRLHVRCDCRLDPLTTPSQFIVANFLAAYKPFADKEKD